MKHAVLYRFSEADYGTCGVLTANDFNCRTIELPWRDNHPGRSRIPDGEYQCVVHHSTKFGTVYLLQFVPSRSWILTHAGNFAGDIEKGFRSNSMGCILLGKYFASIQGQRGIALSKPTIRRFMDYMNGEPFNLSVQTIFKEGV